MTNPSPKEVLISVDLIIRSDPRPGECPPDVEGRIKHSVGVREPGEIGRDVYLSIVLQRALVDGVLEASVVLGIGGRMFPDSDIRIENNEIAVFDPSRVSVKKEESGMSNLPEYTEILERARQLWPQRSDLKLRTKREEAMLEIMSALFDSFGHAMVAHVAEKTEEAKVEAVKVGGDAESYIVRRGRQKDRLLSMSLRLHAAIVSNADPAYKHIKDLLKEAETLFNEIENYNQGGSDE